jgi:hypothetical protein
MCFTDEPMPRTTSTLCTMQIFSVKVEELGRDLHWPLDVYGIIAARDDLDYNRNIIFERKRDNCQTLSGRYTNTHTGRHVELAAPSIKTCWHTLLISHSHRISCYYCICSNILCYSLSCAHRIIYAMHLNLDIYLIYFAGVLHTGSIFRTNRSCPCSCDYV